MTPRDLAPFVAHGGRVAAARAAFGGGDWIDLSTGIAPRRFPTAGIDPDFAGLPEPLDELDIVLRDDTLPIAEVVAFPKARLLTKHICITGRNANPELLEIADQVTDFTDVKHPYRAGFRAQRGVEY